MAAESGKIQTDNYRQLQLTHEMYVDDEYKLVYCPVPKVATSNWRRVLMVMGGCYNSTAEIKDITWGIYTKKFKQLGSFDLEGRVRRLQTYTKVIFVRHPFERLLSAYRDKIERKNTKIQTFQSFVTETEMKSLYAIYENVFKMFGYQWQYTL
ncbi:carbohydrate sulfotransferase 9-like [Saccoglossus kowalevskii]